MRGAPLKTVRIRDATYRAIVDAAVLPYGDWLVEIADDTYERLRSHRVLGETDDDTILWALHVHSGRPNN